MDSCGEVIPTIFGFKWEIQNFCTIYKKAEVGEKIKSPTFTINSSNKMKWQLDIYLKGESEEAKDFLAVYLKYLNGNSISVFSTFSIVNSKNEKIFEKGALSKADVYAENDSWGYGKFVKQSSITDKTNNVLINDTITILCEISIGSKVSHEIVNIVKQLEDQNPCQLVNDFEKLLENGSFTDTIFITDAEEIHVHKSILASRSTVFNAMFQTNMKEKEENKVEIKDIKYAVLKELFRYIYTEKVNRINELASDLLIAADKYSVEGLKLKCERALCDNMTSNNVLEHLKLADKCYATKLKSQAIEFIASHSKDMAEKVDFKIFAEEHGDIMFEIFRIIAYKK